MLSKSQKLCAILLVGIAAIGCTGLGASAQRLTVHITRGAGHVVTDSEGTWERVPASMLWTSGPRYSGPTEGYLHLGSVIPESVHTDPMRNVSIHGLQHYGHYGYFVSPNDHVVIIDSASREVAKIMRHPG
jgi:hypothetical protein